MEIPERQKPCWPYRHFKQFTISIVMNVIIYATAEFNGFFFYLYCLVFELLNISVLTDKEGLNAF